MDRQTFISQCQTHLVDALIARITATEAAVGPVFAFDTLRRGITTLVIARNWPSVPHHLPFHRLYNYREPEADVADALLAYCVATHIDTIVEVESLPSQHTENVLHHYQFSPQWVIPWLHLDLTNFTPQPYPHIHIRKIAPHEMNLFATLFVQGYNYQDASATAWHTFARYGYCAEGFHCFIAEIDSKPVGFGVVHIQEATALVDGTATLPQFRGLGVQKALLTARLVYAQQYGCRHAFSRTGAGSVSHQNMEKIGLQEVYRTIAWRRTISE